MSTFSNPAYGFILSAGGIGTESYLAAQTNSASYIKADALVNENWRYAGGLRYEQFRQASLPIDTLEYDVSVGQCALSPCDVAGARERHFFDEDDVYPDDRRHADHARRLGARLSSCASVSARPSRGPTSARSRARRTSIR